MIVTQAMMREQRVETTYRTNSYPNLANICILSACYLRRFTALYSWHDRRKMQCYMVSLASIDNRLQIENEGGWVRCNVTVNGIVITNVRTKLCRKIRKILQLKGSRYGAQAPCQPNLATGLCEHRSSGQCKF